MQALKKLTSLVGTNQDKLEMLKDPGLSPSQLHFLYQQISMKSQDKDGTGVSSYEIKKTLAYHPKLSSTTAERIQRMERDPELRRLFAKQAVLNYPVFTCPKFFWLLLKNYWLYPTPELSLRILFTIFMAGGIGACFYWTNLWTTIAALSGLNLLWISSRGLTSPWFKTSSWWLMNGLFFTILLPIFFIGNICSFISEEDDRHHREWDRYY